MRLSGSYALAGLVAVMLSVTAGAQQPEIIRLTAVSPNLHTRPEAMCGTAGAEDQRFRFKPFAAAAAGAPLRFTQEPSLLTADYRGAITLRDFLVAGDVPVLQFRPGVPGSDSVETWNRTGTTTIGGGLVSIFNPSWTTDRLGELLRWYETGFDYPTLYWGDVLTPAGEGYVVWLRYAPNSLPSVTVSQLAPDVQYSSSVANLRIDGFGDGWALDANLDAFDFAPATKKFFQHFEDTYDTVAVTTQDTMLPGNSVSGVHRIVRNDVHGIGLDQYDDSASYGSRGRLRGVEMYFNSSMATHKTTVHEAAHQWGDYIDWRRLTGISRAGHQAALHDPLMDGGESLIGAVLLGTRRVTMGTGGAWAIEPTPYPIHFHPTTLYAMGLLSREQIAPLTVFDDQAQFNGAAAVAPDPGTPIRGGARSTTMASVVGMLGPREGPVASDVQRAIVVVSSGRLLTQREMDYWTFFAQRVADPGGTGTPSYDGYVSFDAATGNAADLRHEIRPLSAARIVQPLTVDDPNFAATDARDLVFDQPVPSVLAVGTALRLSGRVAVNDQSYFAVIIRLYREGGSQDDTISAQASVSASGTFAVTLPAAGPQHAGRFTLQVFLFSDQTPQSPRAILGPFTIR